MNRMIIAAGFVLLAGILWLSSGDRTPPPAPTPEPAGLSLRGLFVGPTAADDAATLAAMCEELAAWIEWDGQRDGGPRLKTGVQMDDLRVAAREGRMRGVSIGDRQPHVRKAIHDYLDEQIGVGGGPVDKDQRAKWVTTYRAVARACEDATK
jgi:hypothetical protein